MENDLHCNRLTCRTSLLDKAVVTTCSHIFCVECATELFGATPGVCPACETALNEPDDCVIASLHPTNDYKTSVLSGLGPATVIEIAGRALAFWSYQMQQEHAYREAVLRNATEKATQVQKQIDNVIREANSEISLLRNKIKGTESELENERRKVRELQEYSREKDKEYAKLKNHYEKIKRKALMNPNALGGSIAGSDVHATPMGRSMQLPIPQTPLSDAHAHRPAPMSAGVGGWTNPNPSGPSTAAKHPNGMRQPFGNSNSGNRLGMSLDRSANASVEEVETLLGPSVGARKGPRPFAFRQSATGPGMNAGGGDGAGGGGGGFGFPTHNTQNAHGNVPSSARRRSASGSFKPARGTFNGV